MPAVSCYRSKIKIEMIEKEAELIGERIDCSGLRGTNASSVVERRRLE